MGMDKWNIYGGFNTKQADRTTFSSITYFQIELNKHDTLTLTPISYDTNFSKKTSIS